MHILAARHALWQRRDSLFSGHTLFCNSYKKCVIPYTVMVIGKPWFRKRRGLFSPDLGWGYVPISWEGWVSILVFIGIVLGWTAFMGLFNAELATDADGINFAIGLFVLIIMFVGFCHSKVKKG